MKPSRTLAARICLIAGLVAWVGASFNAVLHKIVVEHVICAEHGEVVELAHGDSEAVDSQTSGPQLRAKSPSPEHAHGCLFDLVVFDGFEIESSTAAAAVCKLPAPAALATLLTLREAPLRYAPKTSPPLAS